MHTDPLTLAAGLELVVGGSMPHCTLISCHQCMVLTGKDAWLKKLVSVGCSEITIHAAHSKGDLDAAACMLAYMRI